MIRPDAAGLDIRGQVVFALDRRAGGSAHDRELADVRQRVGDGALEQLLFRAFAQAWSIFARTSEQCVESGRRREKALNVGVPRLRRRVVPRLFPLDDQLKDARTYPILRKK